MSKTYAAHFEPEVLEGRVIRCAGTSAFFATADKARDAGDDAQRSYVVADENGEVV